MTNKSITYLIVVAILIAGVLITINSLGISFGIAQEKYLTFNGVQGIEVVAKGIHYPLNFEQQNKVISLINHSVQVEMDKYFESDETPFAYEKIIIYPFNEKPIELIPVGLIGTQLLIKAPKWHPQGFLREIRGELDSLLNEAFDK